MKLQLILSAALALLSAAPTAVSAAYPVSGFDFDSADLEDEASFFANRPFGDCGGGIGINSCGRVGGCRWRNGQCERSGGGSSSSSSSGSCFSDRANRNSSNCRNISGCRWRNGQCERSGGGSSSSSSSGSCFSTRANRSSSNCRDISGCRWRNGQCERSRFEDVSSEDYDFDFDFDVYDEE